MHNGSQPQQEHFVDSIIDIPYSKREEVPPWTSLQLVTFKGPLISFKVNRKEGAQHTDNEELAIPSRKNSMDGSSGVQGRNLEVESMSSGAHRRKKNPSSISTSTSGGVALPRHVAVDDLAEPCATLSWDPREEREWVRRNIHDYRLGPYYEPSDVQRKWSPQLLSPYPIEHLLSPSLEEAIQRLRPETSSVQTADDHANTAEETRGNNLQDIWVWYIDAGGALIVFAASFMTALLLITVGQTGIGPAFTTAGWVLAARTLLILMAKTYMGVRLKRDEGVEEIALRPRRQD